MAIGDYSKNILALLFGSFGAAGILFFSQIISAKVLGPYYFGQFNTALIIAGLLVPFANLGLPQYWLQIFTEDERAASTLPLYSALVLLAGNFFAVILFVFLDICFGGNEFDIWSTVSFCVYLLALSLFESLLYLYQVGKKYSNVANGQFVIALLRFSVPSFVWLYPHEIPQRLSYQILIFGYLLISVGIIFFSLSGMRNFWRARLLMVSGSFSFRFHWLDFFSLLSRSVPFFFAGVFYLIYFQGGVVFVRYLVDSSAAGQYGISFTVITGFVLVPGVIYQRFLISRLHEWAFNDFDRLVAAYKVGNVSMLLLGSILGLLLYFVSGYFSAYVLNERYSEVKNLLQVLSLYIPISFVCSNQGAFLTVKKYNAYRVRSMGFVAMLSLPMNYFCILNYGAFGACYALIFCSLLLLMIFWFCVKRYVFAA